jgi:AcrR family transcriptional regulator
MAAETKERILDAAERLFADSGFAATSLRDITSEAEVNLASVNYHFGSKEALLGAILERRLRPINDQRIALLDELESRAGAPGPALDDIVAAFVGPPFHSWAQAGNGGSKFLKLIGQFHSQANEEIRAAFLRQFEQVLARFTAAFERALPDLNPTEVTTRVLFIVGAMAHAMTWGEQPAARTPHEPCHSDKLLDSLISFAAAGMAAPQLAAVHMPAAAEGGRP